MKKYYLSLVCVSVILGCIGVAAGLSTMTPKDKKPDNDNKRLSIAEQYIDAPVVSDDITPPPEPEHTSAPLRIKPSTKLIFESFYQADNQAKVTNQAPPYFLLGLPQSRFQEYYPDWDIVEFNEDAVKLRRTIPVESDDRYVLGVKDNYVAVYQKSDNGSVSLKEVTATPIGALSQDEQNRLISGIYIQNEIQLAQMLEDYGS